MKQCSDTAHEGAGLTEAQKIDGKLSADLSDEPITGERYREARKVGGRPTEGLLLIYPIVNAKEKGNEASGNPNHPWTVAWAMSLPPITEDKKRRVFVPKATWDAWARTRAIIADDKDEEA